MKLLTVCNTEFEVDDEDIILFCGMTFSIASIYVYASGKAIGRESDYVHKIIMPEGECDHIDRNPLNNRRSNLRYVTRSINCFNRGNWGEWPRGISYSSEYRKFRARIQRDYKRVHLGWFNTLEDAIAAQQSAARDLYADALPKELLP